MRTVALNSSARKRASATFFRPENDGKRVVVRGRIFTGPIPERYEISSGNGTPWLLETSAMAFEQRDVGALAVIEPA